MFEGEAREMLRNNMRGACPWIGDHSYLLTRTLERDGNSREADVFCYLEGDSLGACEPVPQAGIAVVDLPNGIEYRAPLQPFPLPMATQFSPTDAVRKGPHKYFVAEVYSGANVDTMVAKVRQLNTLCQLLQRRWMDQHPSEQDVTDVTEIIGAAALVFSAGDNSRRVILNSALEIAQRITQEGGGPLMRLLQARRLLVIVLDKSQSPSTFFQRAVATNLIRLENRLEPIPEAMEQLQASMNTLLSRQ